MFHVFVEGAADGTPAGVARLADAIAKHYGLPAADLLARLQKGRFRVKANADRTTADQYRRDLERLGARCVVEEATPANSQRSTPLPFPAVRPATPPAGTPAVRPATPPAGTAAVRPATPPAGTPQYQSGLSAAFSGDTPAASLGALEGDGAAFSVASLDGADEAAPAAAASFAPPGESMSASIGPPPEKPKAKDKAAKAEKPKDVPLDLFAPPDAQGDEFKVDLAADEAPLRRSEPALPAPAPEAPPTRTSQPAMPAATARKSQPSLDAAAEPVVARSSKLGPLADPRTRFAAGVLLAILIGFVPAHLVASMREHSTYKEIDDKVIAAQQLADTPEAYAMLDKMRADQLAKKQGEQRNAAIIAFAIWGLVGGAIAFGWFKKIPWAEWE